MIAVSIICALSLNTNMHAFTSEFRRYSYKKDFIAISMLDETSFQNHSGRKIDAQTEKLLFTDTTSSICVRIHTTAARRDYWVSALINRLDQLRFKGNVAIDIMEEE